MVVKENRRGCGSVAGTCNVDGRSEPALRANTGSAALSDWGLHSCRFVYCV